MRTVADAELAATYSGDVVRQRVCADLPDFHPVLAGVADIPDPRLMVEASEANATNTVDISKPHFKANPYPFYAHLRAEQPVFPVKLADGQTAWLITRYDDAVFALRDKRFSKDKLNAGQKQPWMPTFFRPLSRNMLDRDDPDQRTSPWPCT